MPLFNRMVSVKIGKPGSENGLGIEGLRVTFDVKKSLKGNTCNVDIYNLSESSRNRISEIDDIIILEAGYTDNVEYSTVEKTIFIGYISRITKEKTGVDNITKIEANDGSKILRDKKLSVSYKSGTSATAIFKDIAKKMGVPQKISNELVVKLNKKSNQYDNAFSFVGQSEEALNKITKQLNIDWMILNNELKVIEKNGTDNSSIIQISPETGLIGSPIRKDDIENFTDKKDKKTGWDFKCLLTPDIEPGGRVSLQSESINTPNSVFKIESVRHVGDVFGPEFTSSVTVSDL